MIIISMISCNDHSGFFVPVFRNQPSSRSASTRNNMEGCPLTIGETLGRIRRYWRQCRDTPSAATEAVSNRYCPCVTSASGLHKQLKSRGLTQSSKMCYTNQRVYRDTSWVPSPQDRGPLPCAPKWRSTRARSVHR